jgi:hypothetical protein
MDFIGNSSWSAAAGGLALVINALQDTAVGG